MASTLLGSIIMFIPISRYVLKGLYASRCFFCLSLCLKSISVNEDACYEQLTLIKKYYNEDKGTYNSTSHKDRQHSSVIK